MHKRQKTLATVMLFMATAAGLLSARPMSLSVSRTHGASYNADNYLSSQLERDLTQNGLHWKSEQSFGEHLNASSCRPNHPVLADVGRILWFDELHALHQRPAAAGDDG